LFSAFLGSTTLRREAAAAIEEVGGEGAGIRLARLVDAELDQLEEGRPSSLIILAVLALGTIDAPAEVVVPPLLRAAGHARLNVTDRAHALEGVGLQLEDVPEGDSRIARSAKEVLSCALEDPSPTIRYMAAEGLGLLRVVEAKTRLLAHRDTDAGRSKFGSVKAAVDHALLRMS